MSRAILAVVPLVLMAADAPRDKLVGVWDLVRVEDDDIARPQQTHFLGLERAAGDFRHRDDFEYALELRKHVAADGRLRRAQ